LSRPLRADAARNRATVLAAAEAVFSDLGTGASTEEIARRAGVGIGTVFRHFPTKESLLQAVLLERLDRLAAHAEALANDPAPGPAFLTFFSETVTASASKIALSEALGAAGVDVDVASFEIGTRMRDAVSALLTRAQDVGAVRADLGIGEVLALFAAASQALTHTSSPEGGRRVLAVILDGLTVTSDPQSARAWSSRASRAPRADPEADGRSAPS
jgi:AcrR family transcriptional regulator